MSRFISFVIASSLGWGCTEYELKGSERSTDGGEIVDEVVASPKWQVDSWESHSYEGTDLIFFGDTSGSMAVELETMGDHALTFMDRLDDYGNSWQIIVVTGWDGCGVNGILTPAVSSYDIFAEALLTPPSQEAIDASADEWGLYDVDVAIQESVPGGCNEGFLRDNALLHVIFLSDEDDNSPGWDGGDPNYCLQTYVDSILASKSSDHLVTFMLSLAPFQTVVMGRNPEPVTPKQSMPRGALF